MKKVFLLSLLIVLGTVGVAFGQYLVSPIKKVIPDHFYTLDELKEFINSNDPIVEEWSTTFLTLVQDGLLKCDEDLFLVKGKDDSRKMVLDIIDKYCIETIRDLPKNFKNSGKTKNNHIKSVIDPRSFTDMHFLTFKFGTCEKDIVKMNCFNLPDLPERKVVIFNPTKEIILTRQTIATGSNWKNYKSPKTILKVNESVKEICKKKEPKDSTTWWQDNKKTIIWGGIATIITSAVIIADHNDWWQKEPQVVIIEDRTMPPGLPALEPVQQPGLPADNRTMPGGLSGMNSNHNLDFSTVSGQRIQGITISIPLGGLRFH